MNSAGTVLGTTGAIAGNAVSESAFTNHLVSANVPANTDVTLEIVCTTQTSSHQFVLNNVTGFFAPVPSKPTITAGPPTPYSIYGPDYISMNDVSSPLITLSDRTGVMCISSTNDSHRFVGPDLDHMTETDATLPFTDAPGDNGAWHSAPGSDPSAGDNYSSSMWLGTSAYATDGELVGFVIGNETSTSGQIETWNGVGVSTDQGRTWQLLGELPVGGISVVQAPSVVISPTGAPFYWYSIGNTAATNGAGTGQMLYASNDIHGAPGSWYVWNGPNSWISISLSTNLATTGTPLPTLPPNLDYSATIIDDQYLAAQSGHAHEYLLTYASLSGCVSYDGVNWSAPFTVVSGVGGYYNRIWDATGKGGDQQGGQDLVEILQTSQSAPPFTSRGMVEVPIHLGPLTTPSAPTIRDASGFTNINPSVRLSWTDTQAQIYTVYRSTNGGSYVNLASVNSGGNYTDYLDKSVTQGQTYSYYVTATNSHGTSPASNIATAVANTIAFAYSLQSGFEFAYLDGSLATNAGNYPLLENGSGALGQRWMLASSDQTNFTVINALTGLALGYNPSSVTPQNINYDYSGGDGQVDVENPTGATKQLWNIPALNLYYLGSYQATTNNAAGQVLEDVQDTSNNGEVYLNTLKNVWSSDHFSTYPQGQTPGAFIINPSFETPVVGSGMQYSPIDNGWFFLPAGASAGHNASGLVGPGSSPAAPDGQQVAFIEQQGSISQNPVVFDGAYTLKFSAQLHGGAAQTLAVYIDGSEVGVVTPSGSTYATYSVGPFRIAGTTDLYNVGNSFPNSHTLTIQGTSTSDGVVYIDNVSLTGSLLSGTVIGTPGSFGNSGNTINNVFDGNLATYFDAPNSNGDWAGLDFGTAANLTAISYSPRVAYENRMVGGVFQGSTTADFSSGVTNLAPAIATNPPDGLSTILVTGSYRYVRYLSPNGGQGNIAEMHVYGDSVNTRLSGNVIGTAGSFDNDGDIADDVFDGNLNTFFDSPDSSGDWAGLDLGAKANITSISYAPRIGYEYRMVGGVFQGSTTPDFSSGVTNLGPAIATTPPDGLTTITVSGSYRYVRYLGPNGGNCNIAEMQVFGN